MPTDDPKFVYLYLNFVHTEETLDQVTVRPSNWSTTQVSNGLDPRSVDDDIPRLIDNVYVEVARIYVLAEQLQDVRTKYAAIVKMIRAMEMYDLELMGAQWTWRA
jgi:hypothetical protein